MPWADKNKKKEYDKIHGKEYREKNVDKIKGYKDGYYLKNKEILNKRARDRRRKKKAWFIEHKKKFKCEECGFSDYRALTFHHRDPAEKEFNLGHATHFSKERILKEMKKCSVLCANCHSILHYIEHEKILKSHVMCDKIKV